MIAGKHRGSIRVRLPKVDHRTPGPRVPEVSYVNPEGLFGFILPKKDHGIFSSLFAAPRTEKQKTPSDWEKPRPKFNVHNSTGEPPVQPNFAGVPKPGVGPPGVQPGSPDNLVDERRKNRVPREEKTVSVHAANYLSRDPDPEATAPQCELPDRTLLPRDPSTRYFVYKAGEGAPTSGTDTEGWWDSEGDHSYRPNSGSVTAQGSPRLFQLSPAEESDDADVEGNNSDAHSAHCEGLIGPLEMGYQDSGRELSPLRIVCGDYAVLTENDVHGLLSQAVKSLSGAEFAKLRVIRSLIKTLTGIPLLDATWRAFEEWEGYRRDTTRDLKSLESVLSKIHELGMERNINRDRICADDILSGIGWEPLDKALQALQGNDEALLREVLLAALKCWDGERCLELLHPEIEQLAPDELKAMQQEALDILQSSPSLFPIDAYLEFLERTEAAVVDNSPTLPIRRNSTTQG
jgi:hypothetical protein